MGVRSEVACHSVEAQWTLQYPKRDRRDNYDGRKGASAGSLTIAAVTVMHAEWFVSAFVPDCAASAATGERYLHIAGHYRALPIRGT